MSPELIIEGLLLTIPIWIGAFVLGSVLAVPVAAGRRSDVMLFRGLSRAWISVWRGVPPVVWLFVIFFGLGWGVLGTSAAIAAIVGLGLVSSAYLGECLRAGLDSVPQGQWDASRGLALPQWVTLRRIVWPQASPIVIASSVTYSITLLKNTSFASLIGANELLWQANNLVQIGQSPGLSTFVIIGLVYIAISAPIGALARVFESRAAMRAAA